ncbi:MAG: hypothetical protein KKD56_12385 [Acidobacteria bacterium]|nr:hypothetical protein [Acidobacteriota bacterium]MBU1339846.1 hypothetical protein [Acidobacteriota bacterium]MCG2816508.1 hypothetical protein [Candidatus Aminicenantes bacterium]
MKERRKKWTEESVSEILVMREKMGVGRYRKTQKRDPEERRILMDLALKKMDKQEEDDFILIGERRRKLKMPD